MPTRLLRLLGIAAALSLPLAACGDDATGPGSADLSEEERIGLLEAILSVGADPELDAPGAAAPTAGPAAAPVTVTFPVDDSFACPLGGSLDMAGEVEIVVDDETEDGTYDHEIEKTHRGCRVTSPRLQKEFVLDGSPSVTATLSAQVSAGALSGLQGSEEGAVAWRLEDRSGTCEIDVAWSVTGPASGAPTYQATGTVCGRSVDVEVQPES